MVNKFSLVTVTSYLTSLVALDTDLFSSSSRSQEDKVSEAGLFCFLHFPTCRTAWIPWLVAPSLAFGARA
jgi:hypothetical protein